MIIKMYDVKKAKVWGEKCRVVYAYIDDADKGKKIEWFTIKEVKNGKDVPIQFDNERQARAYIAQRQQEDEKNAETLRDMQDNVNDDDTSAYY